MKTVTSNSSSVDLYEVAQQIAYSAKVLAIGLFIPFMFVFGITYHTNTDEQKDKTEFTQPNQSVSMNHNTVDLGKVLADQNS